MMEYLIVEPTDKTQYAVLKEFLDKNKIEYKNNKKRKISKIRPAEKKQGDFSQCLGLWKDEKITLKSLRKKIWRKIKL